MFYDSGEVVFCCMMTAAGCGVVGLLFAISLSQSYEDELRIEKQKHKKLTDEIAQLEIDIGWMQRQIAEKNTSNQQ